MTEALFQEGVAERMGATAPSPGLQFHSGRGRLPVDLILSLPGVETLSQASMVESSGFPFPVELLLLAEPLVGLK